VDSALNVEYCIYIQYSKGGSDIRILDTPRLHRQRKGRRKMVRIMDTAELATYFGLPENVDPDVLANTLHEAGWPYHRDAAGRLWSVAPEYPCPRP
jgi:hypothetical protein